jgi:hypothetical protein
MWSHRYVIAALASMLLFAACTSDSSGSDGSTRTVEAAPNAEAVVTTTLQPVSSELDRMLSGDVAFDEGFEVPAGEVWGFDPARTTTVVVGANVVVRGVLVMRPSSDDIVHTLRFIGIDENEFVGGGMEPLASDVGLWVVGDGVLDLQGTPVTPWSYEWQSEWAGDEVVSAPNMPDSYTEFASVDGPESVPAPNPLGYPAELLNLTRNVLIEGTPEGRTHVFIHSTQPQTIRFAAIRHVAPDLQDPSIRARDQDETGRYGIHFHHSGEGSRGSLIEGVVVRDAGNHAFVPHGSNGITFRDTIAFDTLNAAYWWDPTSQRKPGNATNDTLYERAVAALVRTTDGRDPAFQMGEGNNNTVTGSVAVGVQTSGPENSGFGWPGTEQGVWTFRNNVAHNNVGNGIFVWQNSREPHVIDGFTAYYNAKSGVSHGAYRNSYTYRDLTLLENDQFRGNSVAITSRAVGRPSSDGSVTMQLWDGVTTGGAVLRTSRHAQDSEAPVRFRDCDFREVVISEGPGHFSEYEFVECGLDPSDITIEFMHPNSVLRVQDGGVAWEMRADSVAREIPLFVEP